MYYDQLCYRYFEKIIKIFLDCPFQTPFCSSNPCVNGGTCKEAGTSFTCSCPLSIRDLPYTDDRCSLGELIKMLDTEGTKGKRKGEIHKE